MLKSFTLKIACFDVILSSCTYASPELFQLTITFPIPSPSLLKIDMSFKFIVGKFQSKVISGDTPVLSKQVAVGI